MDLAATFQLLAISAGLGLLVGLQRERVAARLAGLRTFPLVTTFGTLSAILAQDLGPWLVAVGVLALTGLIAVGNLIKVEGGVSDPGQTTEVAILLMYAVGAYLVIGHREVAVVVGAAVAVLLHLKPELHGLAGRIGDRDFQSMMQFALISLVILPVLPDRTYGPFAVLNPYQIWLMVVLIVGIGLGGYLAYKFLGAGAGTLLGGLLGGLISSTATTVSFARRTARTPAAAAPAVVVIVIASGVVFVRLLLEIAVVAPAFLAVAGPPLGLLLAVFALLALGSWVRGSRRREEMPEPSNPSELKPALVFGALYAAVLLAVAAAKEYLGGRGLFAVAALSGLTDMDAITLSTARLVDTGRLPAGTAWRLIVVASLSNLVFKAGAVAVLGHRRLFLRVALLYGFAAAAGVLVLAFWPG